MLSNMANIFLIEEMKKVRVGGLDLCHLKDGYFEV